MKRRIVIGVACAGVLGISLGLGSAALAATGSPVPGKNSTHTQVDHGAPTGALKRDGPLTEPLPADPVAVAAGGSVLVKVGDCDPGTPVFLSLGPADKPRSLATVSADVHGVFSGTVHIPADTPAGPESLWAACRAPNSTGKLLHTATITITR